jgi:hypothetical protein
MGSKFFTVMVVGDNPEGLMSKYDKALKVKPYIKYKYLDAEKIRSNAIKMLSNIISNYDKFAMSEDQLEYFKSRLKAINGMSSFEYYSSLTNGLYYDADGNALSEENPDGKWDKYNLGKNFSYPLKLKDGKESYQAISGDIDWNQMHMEANSVNLFEIIWRLVVDDDDPSNANEEQLKNNWKDKKNYLSGFKNVDEFISHNCAYWNYAYLDKNGWVDVDDEGDEMKWVLNFFERFIEPLKNDEKVTIYEFSRSS